MCFSLVWLQNLLVWIVIFFAVVAVLQLLISALGGGGYSLWPRWPTFAGAPAGGGAPLGFIAGILSIALWAFIVIAAIYFAFLVIGCLFSFAGSFPRLR